MQFNRKLDRLFVCFFLNFLILNFFFFIRPLGIFVQYFLVQASYPGPRTRQYEILIYLHRIRSESVMPVGPGLPGPQQLWGRPAFNHFGVRPTITVYGPYALNPLLPGFEPRVLPPSTLAEAH